MLVGLCAGLSLLRPHLHVKRKHLYRNTCSFSKMSLLAPKISITDKFDPWEAVPELGSARCLIPAVLCNNINSFHHMTSKPQIKGTSS